MSVDLSKAKPGDTVTWRCGGKVIIEYANFTLDKAHPYRVAVGDMDWGYTEKGRFQHSYEHPLDIIKVETLGDKK